MIHQDRFHSRWLRILSLSRIDFPPRNMIYTTTDPKYIIFEWCNNDDNNDDSTQTIENISSVIA